MGQIVQKHEVILSSTREVDGLSELLIRLFKDLEVTFDGAGWRSCGRRIVNGVQVEPIDIAWYNLFIGKTVIGKYEFKKEGSAYHVTLDLSGLPKSEYSAVIKSVSSSYPQFAPVLV